MLTQYSPEQFHQVPLSPNFDPAALAKDSPCAHLVLTERGRVVARCSLWWGNRATAAETGSLGHFSAESGDAAALLLEAACALLRDCSCTGVLAPMDGNTWRSYRYRTAGADRPPFLMEPPPAAGRDRWLEAAGFRPRDRYVSYREALGEESLPDLTSLEAAGIRVRELDPDRLEEELHAIYNLAVVAFRENPHYTPLPREAFVRQYLGYRALLDPSLILLAHRGETLAGFLFCIPDHLQGENPTAILLKTIAVAEEYRALGIGRALVAYARHRAQTLGYTECITALLYEENLSRRLCREDGVFREYTLYGRQL